MRVTRQQVLAYRWRTQQLDSPTGADIRPTDVAILALGVQDGANDAARLGLLNRGVGIDLAIRTMSGFGDELALAWSVRGAPHLYRRGELPDVATATSPYSAEDAAKRVVTAAATVRAAGIAVRDALRELGRQMREVVTQPTPKGAVSSALHALLPAAYQVDCRPCRAVHPHEQMFRIAPLHAGLELEPGSRPPVLRRAPGWPKARAVGPADDPLSAPEQLHPVRAYLHLCGPATPKDVAAFLQTQVREVRAVWPEDVAEVDRAGERAWILLTDVEALAGAGEPVPDQVKLLSGYDLFTAAKDRHVLVTDKARAKDLWPVLGRPGVVAAGGELLGVWRPASTTRGLTVRVTPWRTLGRATLAGLEQQAALVAASRGQALAAVTTD